MSRSLLFLTLLFTVGSMFMPSDASAQPYRRRYHRRYHRPYHRPYHHPRHWR